MNDATAEHLIKQAEKLYIEAALMLTRLDRPMKRAVKLVLIDGISARTAATKVGRKRQNVYRALGKVRPKILEVKASVKSA